MMLLVNRREAMMACGGSYRDVSKERFWLETIGEQSGSGLSIRGYCRRHRLRESAFYFWRKELARRGAGAKPKATFVPVRVTGEQPVTPDGPAEGTPPGHIEIALSGGRLVRLLGRVDRQALASVLAVLDPTFAAPEGQ
jgi:transposase-like protein